LPLDVLFVEGHPYDLWILEYLIEMEQSGSEAPTERIDMHVPIGVVIIVVAVLVILVATR
jgi:hypothetical protein